MPPARCGGFLVRRRVLATRGVHIPVYIGSNPVGAIRAMFEVANNSGNGRRDEVAGLSDKVKHTTILLNEARVTIKAVTRTV